MVVDKNLSAQITIHTNFGEFHNESEFTIKEKHEGDDDGSPLRPGLQRNLWRR